LERLDKLIYEMNFNEQLFDKIEDYLKGKLSVEQATSFEKEIANDPSLAEMVEMHRFEQDGMEYLVEKDLKQKLKDWETKPPTDEGKKNDQNPFWKYGLGLLLLAIIASVFIWNRNTPISDPLSPTEEPASEIPPPNTTPVELENNKEEPAKKKRNIADSDPEKSDPIIPKTDPVKPQRNDYLALAESSYILPDNLSSGLRSTGSKETKNVLSPGLKAFAEDKMDVAISEFNKISIEKNPEEYKQAQEYLAHAYFKNEKYEKASIIFKSIADQSKMTALDRAEWYLLLSLLPDYKNQTIQVDALLEKMTDPESYHNYADPAAKIKSELEKINK
jgi:hypothetical protein